MSFSIEETYGISREEYCDRFGISPDQLIKHLQAEIKALKFSLRKVNIKFRAGGSITLPEQRRNAELISAITKKIESKESKVKDIQRNLKTYKKNKMGKLWEKIKKWKLKNCVRSLKNPKRLFFRS